MQSMNYTTRLLRYCGLWRARGDSRLYSLYTHFVTLTVFLNVILMSIVLVTRNEDVKSFTESGGLILTILPCCFGVISLQTKRNRYQGIIESIQAFISDNEPDSADEKTEVVRKAIAEEKKIDVLYFSNVVLASFGYHLVPLVLYIIRRMLGNSEIRLELPIKQMILFGSEERLWFAAEYVLQTVLGCGVIPTLVSLDLLTFVLIKNFAHAFQVLNISLKNVGRRAAESPAVDQVEEERGEEHIFADGETPDCGVSAKQPSEISCVNVCEESDAIKQLSQQHQEMLRNALELVDILKNWLFAHTLVASLLVCSLCFQLQVVEDMRDLFTQASHLTVIMFRLFTLCYFSSELAHQSLSVADAAYFSKWYDLTADAKRCLALIMCRAQRPVFMKTGYFGYMSLNTFSTLLQAAYSYFNIMNDFS